MLNLIKSPIPPYGPSPRFVFLRSPAPILRSIFPPILQESSIFNCKGIEFSAPDYCNLSVLRSSNGSTGEWRLRSVSFKDTDVATFGNLCVDVVLSVPQLPPASVEDRKAYMDKLSSSPTDKKYWEAGGNCNMAIAAARLGLQCITIGHVGKEIYGEFLVDVLHDEGIGLVEISDGKDVNSSNSSYETLLCWVLVDPMHKHGFCSRADFCVEPAFSWMTSLSVEAKLAIKRTKILFFNGYGFDELSPNVITSALEYAVEVGTSVFFDPGPRGRSLSSGTLEEQRALTQFMRMSDVLLLTSEEAESLTGIKNPMLAGQELLRGGIRTKWVIIKMGPRGSILISMSNISCAPAFKVNVVDTVGCGDSFVAAIAFGFIYKMPLVNTLAIANAVGAATAMGYGAGRNVATLNRVIELLRTSNLNEDYEFWRQLLGKNWDGEEITLLSRKIINGSDNRFKCIILEKVVSQLMPTLEDVKVEGTLPS